jgi:hypothetical protein
MIGVMRPASVATAMAMSTPPAGTASSAAASQRRLAAGTSASARATARMTQSLTDTLTPCCFRAARRPATPSRSTSALM